MTTVPKYAHSRIKNTDIRLLKILKIDEDGIFCTLQTFSIALQVPQYTALSYVWSLDDTECPKTGRISIDRKEFDILDTLVPFFNIIQAKEMPLDDNWWWIDSICVNQADLAERSEQVLLMNSIYSRATSTTVWLGNSSEDSDAAMDFIITVHKLTQEAPQKAIRAVLQREAYISSWESLRNLLLRRWWTRVWTMQEFILSRYLNFWCGLKTVNRAAISNAIWYFYECRPNELQGDPAFISGWHRRRVNEWYRRYTVPETAPSFKSSLVALVSYCSNNNATNPKDLLYGLCGLTPDLGLVEIDYKLSVSVEEVYMKFIKKHIEHYDSLDVICFAQLYRSSDESPLPSWVPDWRTRLQHNFVVPFMVSQSSNKGIGNFRPPQYVKRDGSGARYAASGDTSPVFEFVSSDLIARGLILDTIDGLGGSEDSALVQPLESEKKPSNDELQSSDWAFDRLNKVLRCLVLGRRDRYLQNPALPKTFITDFWKFCSDIMTKQDSEIPEAFSTWFSQNRQLEILGCPLESIVQQAALDKRWSMDLEGYQSVKDPQALNSFTARFYDTVVRMGRCLMVSKGGLVGMAPMKSQRGDLICILYGCSVPVVLRRAVNGDKFKLIGECFVDGQMSGEAMIDANSKEISLCIS